MSETAELMTLVSSSKLVTSPVQLIPLTSGPMSSLQSQDQR